MWKPGSWDSSILSAPCVPETNSTSRYGGFLHAEFKRHFELDGKGRVFVPTMKMSDLPAEVDWDAKGFVIPVKDQGFCKKEKFGLFLTCHERRLRIGEKNDSCWRLVLTSMYQCYTFGSTAAVESAFAIKHNQKPISLSEQVLLDCSWKHGNRWGKNQKCWFFRLPFVLQRMLGRKSSWLLQIDDWQNMAHGNGIHSVSAESWNLFVECDDAKRRSRG